MKQNKQNKKSYSNSSPSSSTQTSLIPKPQFQIVPKLEEVEEEEEDEVEAAYEHEKEIKTVKLEPQIAPSTSLCATNFLVEMQINFKFLMFPNTSTSTVFQKLYPYAYKNV